MMGDDKAWVRLPGDAPTFGLWLGTHGCARITQLDAIEDRWQLSHFDATETRLSSMPGRRSKLLEVVDAFCHQQDILSQVRRDSAWREAPATHGQQRVLDRLDLGLCITGMTRGEAADIITYEFESRRPT